MSKLMIFLYAVLFASAVNASSPTALDIVTHRLNEANATHNFVAKTVNDFYAKQKATTFARCDDISGAIMSSLEMFQEAFNELRNHFIGANYTECNKLISHLNETGLLTIENMRLCFMTNLTMVYRSVESVATRSEHDVRTLMGIRAKVLQCGVHSSFLNIIGPELPCTSNGVIDAEKVIVKNREIRAFLMPDLIDLLAVVESDLAKCIYTGGDFQFGSLPMVARTIKCFEQKVLEVRPDLAEVE